LKREEADRERRTFCADHKAVKGRHSIPKKRKRRAPKTPKIRRKCKNKKNNGNKSVSLHA